MSPDDIFAAQMWPWPDPILKRDASGRVVFVNAAFLAIYGGRVESWTGNPVNGWPNPNATGQAYRFETSAGVAPSEVIYDWIEITLADGNALAIARDVTVFQTVAPVIVQPQPPVNHVPIDRVPVAPPNLAHHNPAATAAPSEQSISTLEPLFQTQEAPVEDTQPHEEPAIAYASPLEADFIEQSTPAIEPEQPAYQQAAYQQAAYEQPARAPEPTFEPERSSNNSEQQPIQPYERAETAYEPQSTHQGAFHDATQTPVTQTPVAGSQPQANAVPSQPVQPAPVQPAPVQSEPAAPAVPDPAAIGRLAPAPMSQEPREKRDFERRALPIENNEAVLGTNWRDAVIARAVGGVATEAETAESAIEAPKILPPDENAEPLRILLAEDNAINALLTRTLLEADGCIVDTAEDGILAVEAVKINTYDLILMDMRMPNMDGLEATRKIRAMSGRTAQELPIIALTANAFDDDRNACFDSGMNDFMTKPVSAEELTEMVTTWVSRTRERKEQQLAS